MLREKIKKNNKFSIGFTLVETLVTVSIFLLLTGGITLMLKYVFYTFNQQSLSLDSADSARLALFTFSNEIRNATNGIDGSYPLNQASTSQIIFFSTYGSGNNVNRIRYYITNSTLYKGVIVPTGIPLSYGSIEATSSVLTGLVSTSIFSYFDGNYAGTSTPLAQPVNVNNVKFVQINLTLTKQDIRNATTTFLVSGGAAIRNLKTNLGN